MNIVFMGTPDFAVPSLRALLASGHKVVGVFTQPDKPQGRKMVLTPPIVKQVAMEQGISVYQPETLKEDACMDTLKALAPDLIVVVAYGKLLPKAVLELPRYGCINVHGSLLPRWRGAAPVQWSVLAGDHLAGVTTMQMDVGLDTGDMLGKSQTTIQPEETANALYHRLAQMGAELLLQTIKEVETGTLHPSKQDENQACYAPMLSKAKAQINWAQSAPKVDCFVRGMNSWPIAWTTYGQEVLKIFQVRPAQGTGTPGEILQADTKNGLVIACKEGAVSVLEIQQVGKKRLSIQEYLRGRNLAVGTILGDHCE